MKYSLKVKIITAQQKEVGEVGEVGEMGEMGEMEEGEGQKRRGERKKGRGVLEEVAIVLLAASLLTEGQPVAGAAPSHGLPPVPV